MDRIRRLLAQQPIFTAFDPGWLDLIHPITRLARFATGSRLLCAGDAAEQFFLLTEGAVGLQTMVPSEDGPRPVAIGTLAAGDLLGASWLLPSRQWRYDAMAMNDVEALAIDADEFLVLCEREHRLGYRVMQALGQVFARRLAETRLQTLDVYANWS